MVVVYKWLDHSERMLYKQKELSHQRATLWMEYKRKFGSLTNIRGHQARRKVESAIYVIWNLENDQKKNCSYIRNKDTN